MVGGGNIRIYYDALAGPGWVIDPVYGDYYLAPDRCFSYIFNSNISFTLGPALDLNLNYFVYTSQIYSMPVDGVNATSYACVPNPPPFFYTTVSLPIYLSES